MPHFSSTLKKEERIYSLKLIDALFKGGHSQSLSAFPLRVVYMPMEATSSDIGIEPALSEESSADNASRPKAKRLISVPKRCFKRAVKRNRVKRLVREAYRKNKALIAHRNVALAFIWLDSNLHTGAEIEKRIVNLLKRVNERLDKEEVE